MSDKTLKKEQKKTFSNFFKWSFVALLIICLDLGGIYATIKIVESKGKNNTDNVQNLRQEVNFQKEKITNLESLPVSLAENTQKLMALSRTIGLLSENFEQLNNQVGNNKIIEINNNIAQLNHRIDSLEETRNTDALMLSLALMIKENVLYHRSFAQEADMLRTLNQNNSALLTDIETIQALKTTSIADNSELVRQFSEIIKDFRFGNSEPQTVPQKETIMSKGAKILKNTVSGINFDKVVVLKKEKKTKQQKELLLNLTNLVNTHRFEEALKVIHEAPEFSNLNNPDLASWEQQVKNKLSMDYALSNIMSNLLKALRQDFRENNITVPNQPENDDVNS